MKFGSLALPALCATAMFASARTVQVAREDRATAVTAADKVAALAGVGGMRNPCVTCAPDNGRASAYAAGSRPANAIRKGRH